MAVIDFRDGGHVDAHQRQMRDYQYAHHAVEHDEYDEAGYSADAEADLRAGREGVAARLGQVTTYVGALVSVSLMVGLVVWGAQLVMRDVSGVPVIRALEGDARTAPDNPGGELTPHAGLAVNSVAAGQDPNAADAVAIAPAATGLAEEDVTMGELGAVAHEPTDDLADLASETVAPVVAIPDGAEMPINEAVTELTPEEVPAEVLSQSEAISNALIEAAQANAPAAASSGSTLVRSTRPAPRPRIVKVVAGSAPAAPAATAPVRAAAESAPPVRVVEPGALPSGAPLVQIGAFDSDADAQREWARVSAKFGPLFAGKGRVIQTAESGGRTFWRLRVAGFDSSNEARRFCAAMIAEGGVCIPASAK